jgi:hypothetical protein
VSEGPDFFNDTPFPSQVKKNACAAFVTRPLTGNGKGR